MRYFFFVMGFAWLMPGQAQKSDLSIGGAVVNGITGEPIKGALVTLFGLPDFSKMQLPPKEGGRVTPPAVLPPQTMQADMGGHFLFNGLAEGQFRLTVQKPGFVPSDPDKAVSPIKLAGSISDMQLKLSALGVIEGKVVDQYGDPIRGVNIIALQVRINDGMRTTLNSRSVPTDDRGMYRLWNLGPGKYYIKAAGRSGGTRTYVGDNGPAYDAWESFAPIYSDGSRDLDSATPVVVGGGTQARADFSLTLEAAVKIRGSLGNFVPHQTVRFELLRGAEDVSASRVSLNGTTGRFEIQDVTQGTYTLRATQSEKSRAETTVSVSGTDVNNVNLSLAEGVTVRASLRRLGEAARPAEAAEGFHGVPSFCQATLHATERSSDPAKQLQAAGEDQLAAERVLPGKYRVALQCFGGYPISVLAGGIDLLANPELTITPGAPPAPMEITFKPGGGTLKIKYSVDPPPQMGAVLLVPQFGGSTGPQLSTGFTPGTQDFEIDGLAPGDYTVYAFSSNEDIEFRNPQFLRGLSGGTSVHIDEMGEKEVNIAAVVK